MIYLGLGPRVARTARGTALLARLLVSLDPLVGAEAGGVPRPPKDPWNLWIYRVRLNGNAEEESRSGQYWIGTEINANRVTERWKLQFGAEQEYSARRFILSDGSERRFVLRSGEATARAVRSRDDHWSVGTIAE